MFVFLCSNPTCDPVSSFSNANVLNIYFWQRASWSITHWGLVDASSGTRVYNDTANENVTLTLDAGCYTFELFDPINVDNGLYTRYEHPSFELYLKDVLITLGKQQIDTLWYLGTPQECIYFCTNLIDPTSTINPGNQLIVSFDVYPEYLSLDIINTETEELVYLNEFLETGSDPAQRNLVLSHLLEGCYTITMSDESYDIQATDASFVRDSYNITFNGLLVAYGGYYGISASDSFCTYDTAFCVIPYQCSGMIVGTRINDINTAAGYEREASFFAAYSYKSICNSNLIASSNCYGSYSCSNMTLKQTGTISDYVDIILNCQGYLSCSSYYIDPEYFRYDTVEANIVHYEIRNGDDIYCLGFRACDTLNIVTRWGLSAAATLYCGGTLTCSGSWRINEKISYDSYPIDFAQGWGGWAFEGSFVSVYTNFSFVNQSIGIPLYGYYSFYSTHIKINNILFGAPAGRCAITCMNSNPQFFYAQGTGCFIRNCDNNYNNKSIHTMDIPTMEFIEKLSEMDEILIETENSCNTDNKSLAFDIGYPFYVDEFIFNPSEYGAICCRGYRSCFNALAVRALFGHIVCGATQACKDTVIWNSDDASLQSASSQSTIYNSTDIDGDIVINANIYCTSGESCYQSVLRSSSGIYCIAHESCQSAIVQEAYEIYCTMYGCIDSTINNVARVFLIDSQSGATIFSGGVGEMVVYVRGENAGTDVTIYCNEDDSCIIDCGTNANDTCYNTILHCWGKCTIICDEDITGPKSCPIIANSQSPTSGPSNAPTNAPTVPPTDLPTASPVDIDLYSAALTEDDIESTMQWTMLVLCGVIILIVMAGLVESKCMHNNDRFNYKAIVVFLFYSTDFVSDWFFAAKLMLEIVDFVFFVLFVSSVAFIIVPLIANVFQLHKEISKWNKHGDGSGSGKYNSMNQVKIWIKSRIKIIYVLSFICGSSFSTIALCNSNLFKLDIFSMGLSKKQIAIFQNKRIFSIVFLEVKQTFIDTSIDTTTYKS